MSTASDSLAAAIGREASAELAAALQTVEHCLEQLTDEQIWWRPTPSMNSIGNLMLHLCGNLGQWIISGIGGAEDTRNRPQEFSERGPVPKTELVRQLNETINAATGVLESVTNPDLLGRRSIQGFEVSGLQAMFGSVTHFRGHSQEIVHITRCLLRDDYAFHFVPQTPEQGAPIE